MDTFIPQIVKVVHNAFIMARLKKCCYMNLTIKSFYRNLYTIILLFLY